MSNRSRVETWRWWNRAAARIRMHSNPANTSTAEMSAICVPHSLFLKLYRPRRAPLKHRPADALLVCSRPVRILRFTGCNQPCGCIYPPSTNSRTVVSGRGQHGLEGELAVGACQIDVNLRLLPRSENLDPAEKWRAAICPLEKRFRGPSRLLCTVASASEAGFSAKGTCI